VCFKARIHPPHIAEANADGGDSMIQETDEVELRARCAPGLHKMIKDAANEAARSVSAEIAYRLRRSFQLEANREPNSVI
jgi:hypothetical protein